MTDFEEFAKISRLSRPCVITEKIDGTNAQVHILEDGTILTGSRNRYITPEADNFNFAKWVNEYAAELSALGPGRHYGEWWGSGIQRGYDLPKGEKRFSLFNTRRWRDKNSKLVLEGSELVPDCCHVVPILGIYSVFDTSYIYEALDNLKNTGSYASPGFMKPEGIVIYHKAADIFFKKTIEKDDEYKGKK